MMRIRLEGVAGKRFGYEHNLEVRNPNEAIRALCQLIPGFKAFLASAHEYGLFFQIISKGDLIDYEHLAFGTNEMVLVPVVSGSFFGSSFGQILLGVVLIAFAFTGFGFISFGGIGTISAAVQSASAALGFGLLFTGVAGLFAPGVPSFGEDDREGAPADEAILNSGAAVAPDGTPIPVVYGETLVKDIPIITSYLIDGEGEVGEGGSKAYWMGVLSEGDIEGFPTNQNDDIFFNGLKGRSAGVETVQFTRGNQTTVPTPAIQNQGFSLAVGATFPVGGGSYNDRLSESESPNTVEIRSFNQPYADTIRVRMAIAPVYQTENQTRSSGRSTFNYRDYGRQKDGNGGGNNPTRYEIKAFENGSEFFSRTYVIDKEINTLLEVTKINCSGRQQPISVRVERTDRATAKEPFTFQGETSTRIYNWVKGDITWLSMEVQWNERLVYPKTSVLGLVFDTGALTQIPAITCKLRGRRVPVIRNNLSVGNEYSNNPACVLLDLLTNPRYGAGSRTYNTNAPLNTTIFQPGISIDDVDKASFLQAQRYCERNNITFNATINGDADTVALLRSVASSFQAQLVYAGGFVTVVIDDRLGDDISNYRLFSEANVIQDNDVGEVKQPCFRYEGTSRKARTTAVQVSFINGDNFFDEEKALVEDRPAMQKYGYNLKKIRALGCTNRQQAIRLGRYTLATNLRSTETVTFKVGPEGALLLPGEICLIADPLKTRFTSGGRIVSATGNSITVDREIDGIGDNDLFLYTYTTAGIAQRSTVTSINGATINVSGLSSTPSSNVLWLLIRETANNEGNRFNRYRVQKVTEDTKGTFEVVAIKYDDAKYDFINSGVSNYGGVRRYGQQTNGVLNPATISFRLRN